MVGGSFVSAHDWLSTTDKPRSNLVRLFADHSIDDSFHPDPNNLVNAIALQADGRMLVAGAFTTIGGVGRAGLARLAADGSVDPGFDSGAQGIYALAVQADGSILVGGCFTTIGSPAASHAIPYLARLHADGSVDTGYVPNVDHCVHSIALSSDGSAVIGGEFGTVGNMARVRIARVLASGALDTSFDPGSGASGSVQAIVVQPDGKILVGGEFDRFAGNAAGGLVRLAPSGTVDAGFAAFRPGSLVALALQADGKVLAAGGFYMTATLPYTGLIRMNADGCGDAGFPATDEFIQSLAAQADGRVAMAGQFTAILGQARTNLAFLSAAQAPAELLDRVGSAVIWHRSGSCPELESTPLLEFSVVGNLYAPLGPMHRIAAGWRYDGFAAPVAQNFFLRARGATSSGAFGSSAGLVATTRWLFGSDEIFAGRFE